MNFDLIEACRHYLHLKGKIDIIFTDEKNKYAVACHSSFGNKKKLHIIHIYTSNAMVDRRCVNTLIAHELIHAWQSEYNKKGKVSHGPDFQLKAYFLTRYLRGKGIKIGTIYDSKVDVEF